MSISRIVIIIAGGFFLFAGSRGIALLATNRLPHPQLEITPSEIDLGTVNVGQPIERTFLLRNIGTARLLITDVKSTCQCTVADLSSRTIMPGNSDLLHVTFNATGAGKKSQRVSIQSNDPDIPIQALKLTAVAIATTRP